MDFNKLLAEIKDKQSNLFGNDFLLTWDKSVDELQQIVHVAEGLKMLRDNNISSKCFESGLAISQFRDNSTRTRFSFASACNLLGLEVQDLDEAKSQIAHGETVRETSVMISFLSEVVGIRDDMYLGAGHAYMKEVGTSLSYGYEHKILPQRPAIVNLQCDIDHPTQCMADLAWLKEYYGSWDALRGKKVAMTWAYSPSYGKPLSVPQGIIGLMTRFGMDVTLAHPEGYDLIPEVVETARMNAHVAGSTLTKVSSMEEAFDGADIVYPKSWAPYHVMEKRTQLLRSQDMDGLKTLEKSCLTENAKHMNWECNADMMKRTKDGAALYMHCLPADISGESCTHGEVAREVFDNYRTATYKEAGYKPYIIAAMILCSRFKDPAALLDHLKSRNLKNRIM